MTAQNPGATPIAGHESPESPAVAGYDQRSSLETRALRVVQRFLKRHAQRLLWHGIGAVGYLIRQRHTPTTPLYPGNRSVRRILVVRVDLLGDTVLTTPAIAALRRGYPHARIDALVQQSTADVLAAERDITRIITYNPQAFRRRDGWLTAVRLLWRLRRARYDIAISVSGDIGSILTRLSGSTRSVGYAGEAYPYMLTDPVPGGRYKIAQHETRYVLALAEAAGGIVTAEDRRPRLRVVPDKRQEMATMLRLARARLGRYGPIIAMHAGARNGRAKRWPTRHFAVLADQLAEELDALVVVTGAPNEAPLARDIVQHTRHPLLNVSGKTSLPQLVALLAESDVLVTGDSGPMHIACAVETPVVVMHGPTDPALSGPTAPDAIVLRHMLWCSPCYDASATAECRFGNPVCMKAIAPRVVFAAIHRQLKAHGWRAQSNADDTGPLSVPSLP
ncbi:MAG TPA: lipopolysaccharide heptosyltransferase II [Ktedonobacterales bacterium]|nr:lipopolysaccharide heptosyltransferase II [Ktedonobacterales bacterium]